MRPNTRYIVCRSSADRIPIGSSASALRVAALARIFPPVERWSVGPVRSRDHRGVAGDVAERGACAQAAALIDLPGNDLHVSLSIPLFVLKATFFATSGPFRGKPLNLYPVLIVKTCSFRCSQKQKIKLQCTLPHTPSRGDRVELKETPLQFAFRKRQSHAAPTPPIKSYVVLREVEKVIKKTEEKNRL